MSKTVDERVVSMKFDNADFESNVKTSLSTLDKLKQSLNFTGSTKGLEDIAAAANKVSFNSISDSIESVKSSFSALETVATGALLTIGSQAVTVGEQLLSSLTVDNISSGWEKYIQKTASVQTIMNATSDSIDQVNKYLNQLMWYSDETSYGFTDMTAALAQMTSSGGDIETLIPMITGVANAVAYAGKGATEFSRVMYNLNQSYGAGYLTYSDWRSVELAGAGSSQLKQTLIDTGVELGKIQEGEVTVATFASTLSDKWADTEVMEAAFGKFADLSTAAYKAVSAGEYDTASQAIAALSDQYSELGVKAFQSAQEAKSFTEAIEATKDAVSSGWMRTFEIIFGNYEEAKELWTDLSNVLYDAFAAGADDRNEMLEEALGGGAWDEFEEQITKAGISMDDFNTKLYEVAKENGINIDDLIEEYGSLEKAMRYCDASGFLIVQTLQEIDSSSGDAVSSTQDLTEKLEYFQQVVDDVWYGAYDNGEARIEALTAAGYDYAEVQDLVNKTEDGHRLTLEDLNDTQLAAIGYTEEQIEAIHSLAAEAGTAGTSLNDLIQKMTRPTGRELAIDAYHNVVEALTVSIGALKKAWNETVPQLSAEGIYQGIKTFKEFTEKLILTDEQAEKLGNALKGLFSIVDLGVSAFKGFLQIVKSALSGVKGLVAGFLDVGSALGLWTSGVEESVKSSEKFKMVLDKVCEVVKTVSDTLGWLVYDSFQAFISAEDKVTGGTEAVRTAINNLAQMVIDVVKLITGIDLTEFMEKFDPVEEKFLSLTKKILEIARSFKNKIKDILTSDDPWQAFKDATKDGLNVVKDFASSSLEAIRTWCSSWKTVISEAINEKDFTKVFSKITDSLDELFKTFTTTIKKYFNSAFDAIDEVSDGKLTKLKTNFTNVFDKITGVIKDFISFLKNTFVPSTNTHLGSVVSSFSTAFSKIGDTIVSFITNIPSKIASAFTTIGTTISSLFSGVSGTLGTAFATVDTSDANAELDKLNDKIEATQASYTTFSKTSTSVFTTAATSINSLSNISLLSTVASIIGGTVYKNFRLLALGIGVVGSVIGDTTTGVGKMITTFQEWLTQTNLVTAATDKLKDVFSKLANSNIGGAFSSIFGGIGSVLSKVLSVIKGFVGDAGNYFTLFGDYVKRLDGGLSFTNIIKTIKAFVFTVTSFLKELFSGATTNIGGTNEQFMSFTNASTHLKSVAEAVFPTVSKIISALGDVLAWVIGLCTDFISDVGLGGVITIIGVFATLSTLKTAANALNTFGKAISNFSSPFKSLSKLIDGFGEANGFDMKSSNKLTDIAELIKAIAEAVGVITVAIVALAALDSGRLDQAMSAMEKIGKFLLIVLAIGETANIVSGKLNPNVTRSFSTNLSGFGLALIGVAAIIKSAVDAFKEISEMEMTVTKAIATIGVIAGLVGSLLLLASIFNEYSKNDIKTSIGNAIEIIAVAAALQLMVKAINTLAEMDPEKAVIGIIEMGAVVEEMFILCMGMSLMGKGTFSSAIGIVALIISVVYAIKSLSKVDPESAITAVTYIGLVFSEVIALLGIIGLVNRFLGSTTAALTGVAAIILAMTFAIRLLGKMENDEIARGIIAITSFTSLIQRLMITAGVVTAFTEGDKEAKIVAGLGAVGVCMILMAVAVRLAGGMDPVELANGITAIKKFTALIAILELATAAAAKISGGKESGIASLIAVAAIIAELTICVLLLSLIKEDKLDAASNALAKLMIAFAVLDLAVAAASKIGISGKALASLAVVELLVAGLALIVAALANGVGDAELIDSASNALIKMIAMLETLMVVVTFVGNFSTDTIGGGIATLALVEVLVAALALVIAAIANIGDADKTVALMDSVSNAMLKLSEVMLIITAVGLVATVAIEGIGAMVVFLTVLTAVLGVLGELTNSKVEETLTKGIELIVLIAEGLGTAIGKFIEAISEGVGNAITNIGSALVTFGAQILAFSTTISVIDINKTVTAVNAIVSMLAALTSESIKSAIGSFVSGWFGEENQLSSKLQDLGEGMVTFANTIEPLKTTTIMKAQICATMLEKIMDIVPTSGGVLSFFTGGQNYSKFKTNLETLAEAIVGFAKKIEDNASLFTDSTTTHMNYAVSIGTQLANLADVIPTTGGLVSKIAGTSDLSDFGDKCKVFIEKMIDALAIINEHSDLFVDENTSRMTTARQIGEDFATFSDAVPKTGILQDLLGTNDIGDFGERCKKYIEAIVEALKVINENGDIFTDDNIDHIDYCKEVGEKLQELSNTLDKTGGFVQLFTGTQDLSDFGEQISAYVGFFTTFLQDIQDSADLFSDENKARVDNLISISGKMTDIANAAPSTSLFDGKMDLTTLGSHFEAFGYGLLHFWGYVSDIDASRLGELITWVRSLVNLAQTCSELPDDPFDNFTDSLEYLGSVSIDACLAPFNNATEKYTTAASNFIGGFITALGSHESEFSNTFEAIAESGLRVFTITYEPFYEQEGATLVTRMASGVVAMNSTIIDKFKAICVLCAQAIQSYYNDFYTAGGNLAIGTANGITENTFYVQAAAVAMGQKALEAAKDAMQEQSPSKATYQMGAFLDIGAANGIADYTHVVTDAANSMGEDTLDEFQMVMNGISDVFNNTDIDPVITPVVDLSEIQNGVDAINSMSDQIDLSTSIAYANSASPFTTGTPLTVMQDELAKLSASLSGTGNNQQTTNNNTFNITSTDPKGAADEVSRILQQQVERRNAVWA